MTKANRTVQRACAVGWILSAYAVYVEYKIHKTDETDENNAYTDMEPFKALCDLESIGASCSKVFALPQGRMLSYFGVVPAGSLLDVPNAALGMVHYTYMLLFSSRNRSMPALLTNFMVAAAFGSTVFLAYQLTFVVPELCVLCWTTHVINTYVFYKQFFGSSTRSKTKEKTIKRV